MNAEALFRIPAYSDTLQAIAREAGARIMAHRAAASENTRHKADGSPVTAADHEAQRLIIDGLAALTPDIPIVAEEKPNPPALASGGTYWLVDPLDGTLDFVRGGQEFSVNMGLVVDGVPTLGVLYAPACDDLFYGEPDKAFRVNKNVHTLLRPSQKPLTTTAPHLITSRREAKRLPVADWLRDGLIGSWRVCSSAYKFGLLAAGEHDLFIRTGLTFEWDTAAGDAILRAVGGKIMTSAAQPLTYGKADFRNSDFIAYGTAWDSAQLPDYFRRLGMQGAYARNPLG